MSSTACALPLAKAIRAALVATAMATITAQGREEKAGRIYSYVTGQQFRAHVSAIVESCAAIKEGLDAEKRFFTRQWAKRGKHIELLLSGTAAMHGALQAIAGRSLPEVNGLDAAIDGEVAAEPIDKRAA